jgi:3-deoxy-manno-octulosonate cytidylyltransferase (CMP-KDO synthetase)
MKVIGVIPARYESTRLPRKLLRDICGKPLLQWTYEAASKAKLLDKLIIACDDIKVKEACDAFGANCVMTSLDH